MSLAGRAALVTGANRGIGLEVCRQLAALGCAVILAARNEEKAQAAAEAVGGFVRGVRLDVTDQDSVDAAFGGLDRLDILVNNAGINYDSWARAETADVDGEVRATLETNLLGAWRVARAALPFMRRGRWGRVVNVSSEAGSLDRMGAGPPAYQVSKAALNALTRTLGGELRGTGVLVNSICPGWVATDMGGAGGRPVRDGAASVVWGATLPDDGPSGGFFRDGKPLPW